MKLLISPFLLLLAACVTPAPKTQTAAQEFAIMPAMAVTSGDGIEAEIAHSAERIIDIAEGWIADPSATEQKASEMRSMTGYLLGTAEAIEDSLVPEPPVVAPPGQLDTQLTGKSLPARPSVNIHGPRNDRYGAVVDNTHRDFGGGHVSGVQSTCVLMKGNASIEDAVFFGSDGDAMKFDGGPAAGHIVIKRVHLFGLGTSSGAHADGLQGRGNMLSGLIEDVFFDQPTNRADGTRSNACVIMDNSQGPNGLLTMRRCILRGGNRNIMMADKGSGRPVGTMRFESCAFIVEQNSPRYTLLQPGYESSLTFDDDCAVYYNCRDSDSGSDHHRSLYGPPHAEPMCHLLTRDIADFDMKNWHLAEFGSLPAN